MRPDKASCRHPIRLPHHALGPVTPAQYVQLYRSALAIRATPSAIFCGAMEE
jgi:hypothetical protein